MSGAGDSGAAHRVDAQLLRQLEHIRQSGVLVDDVGGLFLGGVHRESAFSSSALFIFDRPLMCFFRASSYS